MIAYNQSMIICPKVGRLQTEWIIYCFKYHLGIWESRSSQTVQTGKSKLREQLKFCQASYHGDKAQWSEIYRPCEGSSAGLEWNPSWQICHCSSWKFCSNFQKSEGASYRIHMNVPFWDDRHKLSFFHYHLVNHYHLGTYNNGRGKRTYGYEKRFAHKNHSRNASSSWKVEQKTYKDIY